MARKHQLVVGLRPGTFRRIEREAERTGESMSLFGRQAIEAAYPIGAPPPKRARGIPGRRPPETKQLPILVDLSVRHVLNAVVEIECKEAERQGEVAPGITAVAREAIERMYPPPDPEPEEAPLKPTGHTAIRSAERMLMGPVSW